MILLLKELYKEIEHGDPEHRQWLWDKMEEFSNRKTKEGCCPVCGSSEIADNSIWENNGIIGPGYRTWKISDTRSCKKCGTIFTPIPNSETQNPSA